MSKQYDVIIVGGGISGAIAAISASRSGVRTLLIEQHGFLGGMLTAAGVGPMMTFHAGNKQIIQGITGELIDRMILKGKSIGHIPDNTDYTYTITPFDAEGMKHELEIMLLESGGELLYHTMLADVEVSEGEITCIKVCNKAGIVNLTATVYVDATGDADLSAWAGVDFQKGRESDGACQPMTMNLKMRNVDIAIVKKFINDNPNEFPRLKMDPEVVNKTTRLAIGGFNKILEKAEKSGEISFRRGEVLFFETNYPGEVIVNTSRIIHHDSTDPWSLTRAEIEGKKQVRELENFLIKRIPGFEDAILVGSGPSIGVRSSRNIRGMFVLTPEDLITCRKFEDTIAHGAYPIDIHSPDGAGPAKKLLKKTRLDWGEMYNIPYRCLVNSKVSNLITVGRCISTTFEAQGAIRVTPIAGATGHAGGAAAALAVKNNVKVCEVNISVLQETLRKQGAYLEI
jgi:hypothetical protein